MHNILYDNILFSIQKSGGASVLWQEMLGRLIQDSRFNISILEYDDAIENIFRKKLAYDAEFCKSALFLKIKRYFDINKGINDKHIFHSSLYRISNNSNAQNVTTVHDFTYERHLRGLPQKVHSWQKNKAIRNSDRIICVSDNTRKDLHRFVKGIDDSIITVIHNGVSDDFHITENLIDNVDIPYGKNEYILFVGARTGYKNFTLAVKAAQKAGCALVAVGGGELTAQESALVATTLDNKFFKVGLVSNSNLNILYNNAIALVYPSLYEGFGIPVIEGQKAGCPVIATYGSSIVEIIGDTNIVIDNPDVDNFAYYINTLSRNADLRLSEVEKGLENSKRFSWDNTYKKLSDLYLSM